jgi:hypothetical protein
MSAAVLLREKPNPSETDIDDCTIEHLSLRTYQRIRQRFIWLEN